MEHKTNWKNQDIVKAEDLNRIEGNNSELESPSFDDSGTVSDINSFTDFINSIKSKMNIFQFYRDFKAGMKYVLHTGRLANNATTTQEGFALDARMGKTLYDMIAEQNKNLTSYFVQENTLELKKDTKKTVLYQNKNLGTVLSEAVLGSRKRSDLILTLDKLILARYDEEDRVIENSQVATNSDLKAYYLLNGTILDSVLKQTINKVFFIVNSYFPPDIPEQNEGFLEILVDEASARKLVRFTTYYGDKIYQRRTFNSAWDSNWYLYQGEEVI